MISYKLLCSHVNIYHIVDHPTLAFTKLMLTGIAMISYMSLLHDIMAMKNILKRYMISSSVALSGIPGFLGPARARPGPGRCSLRTRSMCCHFFSQAERPPDVFDAAAACSCANRTISTSSLPGLPCTSCMATVESMWPRAAAAASLSYEL
jgi:hypothetical protein